MSAVCGWIRITIAGRDHEMVALAEGARLSDLYRQLEPDYMELLVKDLLRRTGSEGRDHWEV